MDKLTKLPGGTCVALGEGAAVVTKEQDMGPPYIAVALKGGFVITIEDGVPSDVKKKIVDMVNAAGGGAA